MELVFVRSRFVSGVGLCVFGTVCLGNLVLAHERPFIGVISDAHSSWYLIELSSAVLDVRYERGDRNGLDRHFRTGNELAAARCGDGRVTPPQRRALRFLH